MAPLFRPGPYLDTYRRQRTEGIRALSAMLHRRLLSVCNYKDVDLPTQRHRRLSATTPLAILGWLACQPARAVLYAIGPLPIECRSSYRFAIGRLASIVAATLFAFIWPLPQAAVAGLLLGCAPALHRRLAQA